MQGLRFLLRRGAISLVTLLGVMVLVFTLVRVVPGDPARLRAGPYADAARIEQVRADLRLDDPLPLQFARFVGDAFRLDLGASIRSGVPVVEELAARFRPTLELSFYALVLALVLGVGLGILAALRQGTFADSLVRGLVVIGTSTPIFWLGVLLILVFFSILGWAPAPLGRMPVLGSAPATVTGLYTVDALLTWDLPALRASLSALALPVLTLALVLFAPIANITRTAMLRELGSDYVRAARSIGIGVTRDALRNAMLPVMTTIGVVFGYLIGGNVLVEALFAWPGIGQYAWLALGNKDIPALQGVVLLVGAAYILLNIAIDVLYTIVDPRVRLES